MIDLIMARLERIEQNQLHLKEMLEHRMGYLERQVEDHEERIRSATEGVTQFKVWSGLTSAGSGVLSNVATIKAFFGG